MTKKQHNYQLRLAAIAVIFAAVAVLFMQNMPPGSETGVVSGIQTSR